MQSKKEVGFWANAKCHPVNDKTAYNHAMGKLFVSYGVVFIVLGIPLLGGQNSPLILVSIAGVMMESILAMVIYELVITRKYEKKETLLGSGERRMDNER